MLGTAIEPLPPSANLVAIAILLFSIALAWAIFSAFGAPELHYARTVRLIWMSLLFATAALAFYSWTTGRRPLSNYWRLTWTCALALYLIHFSYGLFIVHEGSISSVYEHQGVFIATANFLLTAIWSYDVVTAWTSSHTERPRLRCTTHILVLLAFLIATLIFGSPTAKWLGGFMAFVLLVVGVARCIDLKAVKAA